MLWHTGEQGIFSMNDQSAPDETRLEQRPEAKPQTVVVVDDSSTMRAIITKELEEARYTVISFSNGMEALSSLLDACPARPDHPGYRHAPDGWLHLLRTTAAAGKREPVDAPLGPRARAFCFGQRHLREP